MQVQFSPLKIIKMDYAKEKRTEDHFQTVRRAECYQSICLTGQYFLPISITSSKVYKTMKAACKTIRMQIAQLISNQRRSFVKQNTN